MIRFAYVEIASALAMELSDTMGVSRPQDNWGNACKEKYTSRAQELSGARPSAEKTLRYVLVFDW